MGSLKLLPISIIAAIILAVSMLPSANAGMDFSYHCYDENCREGTKIDYSVRLVNTANVTLTFDHLILRNDQYNAIVDFDVSAPVVLESMGSHFFNFSREVKVLPPDSYTLTVRPCLEVKHEREPGVNAVYSFCALTSYNIPVLPNSRIECNSSAECSQDEECFYFRCKALSCGEGQIAGNHECTAAACAPLESRINNACQKDPRKIGGVVLVAAAVAAVLAYLVIYRNSSSAKKNPRGKKQ